MISAESGDEAVLAAFAKTLFLIPLRLSCGQCLCFGATPCPLMRHVFKYWPSTSSLHEHFVEGFYYPDDVKVWHVVASSAPLEARL